MRVLYLSNIPNPYRVAFFDELGRGCDLTVCFERKSATNRNSKWTLDLPEGRGYREIFLPSVPAGPEGALAPGVLRYVLDGGYDAVVVGGYSTPTGALAISALRAARIPYLLNADGGFVKPDRPLVYRAKKFLISGAASWLSTGQGTSDYLSHYGADGERCFTYPFSSVHAKDVASRPATAAERADLRASLGITHEHVVLGVGRFLEWKGFDTLIRTGELMPPNTGIYIVGDTPTAEYKALVDERGVHDSIRFIGFRNGSCLRQYYRAADVFATATRADIWGLVVNEALAQGVPVVSSDRCGAALEMIEEGLSGHIVPVDDFVAMGAAINGLLHDSAKRDRMAAAALTTANRYTIEEMVASHLRILEAFVQARSQSHRIATK